MLLGVIGAGECALTEGPTWCAATQELLWVDIERGELHWSKPDGSEHGVRSFDAPVTALALTTDSRIALGLGCGVSLVADRHADPTELARCPTGDRTNDGKCDPLGRFLIGTMTEDRSPGAAALYRLSAQGGLHRADEVVGNVTMSNGLDWSDDGSLLYFADTPTRRVDVFDYDVGVGVCANRRPFVDLAKQPGDARPDGLTVDSEGGIWVAAIRAGEVHRYSPEGTLDAVFRLPARRVTSCCFGGSSLETLFVTSAKDPDQPADAEPQAGGVFVLDPGIKGRVPFLWEAAR